MYRIVADAANLMRLQVKPPAEYTYLLSAVVGALLAIGAVNAASIAPWFQGQYGFAAFMFCLHVLKWPFFSWMINQMLKRRGEVKQNYAGLVLASELLTVPVLLNLYVPQAGFLVMLWQSWAFVATVLCLSKLSEAGILKVLLGYFLGFVFLLPAGLVLLLLFAQLGWVDLEQMNAAMQEMMQQPPR